VFRTPHSIGHPRFIAHRGFTPVAPENSLPAFEAAGLRQYWAIESDVRVTKDGFLVCNHNDTIDSMYDGTGSIAEMSYEQLLAYQIIQGNGANDYPADRLRIPLYDEYIEICRKYGCIPFVELKAGAVKEVVDRLIARGLENYAVVSSSRLDHLIEVREYSRALFIHHIFSKMEWAEKLAKLGNAGMALNYTDMAMVPPDDVSRLHSLGLKVCFRACDSAQAVKEMTEKGADYLPTNVMY
jgi:glycerophosphoryl diester phosphodiesterase